jgi:ORF6N domain-containing protein/regulatory Fis family protein
MLDSDLAELYGVATKVLVQAANRNIESVSRMILCFSSPRKNSNPLRSQTVTSNRGRGGRRYAPYALHRAGRRHAFQRIAKQARRNGEHSDHAGVCEAARDARHASRAAVRIYRVAAAARRYSPSCGEFVERFATELGVTRSISPEAIARLEAYDWSETYGMAERRRAHCNSKMDRFLEFKNSDCYHDSDNAEILRILQAGTWTSIERRAIWEAVKRNGGEDVVAARMLGIGKTTLHRKLMEYGCHSI